MKRISALRAIRKFCLECVGNSSYEVNLCVAPECPLFLFRKGHNPKLSKLESKSL